MLWKPIRTSSAATGYAVGAVRSVRAPSVTVIEAKRRSKEKIDAAKRDRALALGSDAR